MPTEVTTAPIAPVHETGLIANIIVNIVKYWVWFLVGFITIVIVITIILLIKKMKKRIDPFADEYRKVKALCKFQRDPTIRSVYLVSDKGIKYIGKYMGEAITQDGYRNVLFWRFKKWFLFWFPSFLDFFDVAKETMIIRCNVNKIFVQRQYDPKTKLETEIEIKLVSDVVAKSEEKMIIKGWGLERYKYFLYPVLIDREGNTVDKSLEIFERERTPAIISTMYQQAEDFANVSRELININPSVRYITKTGEPIIKEKQQ